jgi:hypothetical protein
METIIPGTATNDLNAVVTLAPTPPQQRWQYVSYDESGYIFNPPITYVWGWVPHLYYETPSTANFQRVFATQNCKNDPHRVLSGNEPDLDGEAYWRSRMVDLVVGQMQNALAAYPVADRPLLQFWLTLGSQVHVPWIDEASWFWNFWEIFQAEHPELLPNVGGFHTHWHPFARFGPNDPRVWDYAIPNRFVKNGAAWVAQYDTPTKTRKLWITETGLSIHQQTIDNPQKVATFPTDITNALRGYARRVAIYGLKGIGGWNNLVGADGLPTAMGANYKGLP